MVTDMRNLFEDQQELEHFWDELRERTHSDKRSVFHTLDAFGAIQNLLTDQRDATQIYDYFIIVLAAFLTIFLLYQILYRFNYQYQRYKILYEEARRNAAAKQEMFEMYGLQEQRSK